MHSRRKFLVQGSMATTAVLALKPFATMARIASPFIESGTSSTKLFFLHTSNMHLSNDHRDMLNIKNKHSHVILLHAGENMPGENRSFSYDASTPGNKDRSAITGEYKIIRKGALRIGIISAKPEENNVIQKTETLSAYLKKEKNCHIVLCLSQLGYQNKNAPDDLLLAKKSTHLDLIIGGHQKNFHALPVIALNAAQGEVVIHSASGDPSAFGIINFDFDGKDQKKSIGFTT
jgi:hypothetical protein